MKVEINNIDNSFGAYQRLIDFFREHKDSFFDIIEVDLKFWFAANMSAALGGVLDLISDNLNTVKVSSSNKSIETILLKNNFLSYYGYQRIADNYHTTIQYLKLTPKDGKYFNQYVVEELIGRAELPSMSAAVKEKMTEAIYEIFVNAQIHSETKNIYTCGQFFPKMDKIEFTIVDTGIGFKEKINRRFKSNLTSVQAIKWAVQDKTTTKIGITGGIGLALLKEFIEKNKGKMQIVSDDGFYEFGEQGEKNGTFNGKFPGTIVNLQFRTNDFSSYSLNTEITTSTIF